MKNNRIVAIQTYAGGKALLDLAFIRADLRSDSFIFRPTADNIENFILRDEPQMLITGSISKRWDDLPELVERLKVLNPKLVVVFFSLANNHTSPLFNIQIDKVKPDSLDVLADVIKDFARQNPD